ncbi:hypothetical protein [Pontiella agarivorans]|uniref:Lambda-carrageenase n=1 Tax=Pontiella agarivorans TaxID=3038953 RepID=A0ABU5N242_9BACT|nr:hypothetical protein [Pontiella agarivorans]MDZ8120502.1 hypothetical protein [Pontiella agarivorans]
MHKSKRKIRISSRKLCSLATVMLLPMIGKVYGDFLVDGPFSSGITEANTGSNETSFDELDAGWDHKGSWDLSNGSASNTATRSQAGLAQVVSIGSASGNVVHLSIDWMPPSDATGTQLNLTYQVIAWKKTGTPESGKFFVGINYASPKIGTLDGTTAYTDLLNGTYSTTEANQSRGTFTGTAGLNQTFSVDLPLSSFSSGLDDISEYDYIGIRLATENGSGGIVDNVMLSTGIDHNMPQPLTSIDTGWTIQKVRTAAVDTNTLLIGSSYEGALIGMTWDGTALWTNHLSGYMNHDLWCDDLTGDGTDEILVANADGRVYCVDSSTGSNVWNYVPNDGGHLPPMYAVCTVHSNGTPYVVCGAFDKFIHYIDAAGAPVKSVDSHPYSIANTWGNTAPPDKYHNANFLRPFITNGVEKLALLGSMSHMQDNGVFYLFDPLADMPYLTVDVNGPKVSGDLRVMDPDGDGNDELIIGSSALNGDSIVHFDPRSGEQNEWVITGNKGSAGYRVTQVASYPDGDSFKYFVLCGATLSIATPSGDSNIVSSAANYQCSYAFNDLWQDPDSGKIVLASAQSGGSCIHIIDTRHSNWLPAFEALNPPGKIAAIIANTAQTKAQLSTFTKPAWERDPVEVILTAASPTHPVAQDVISYSDTPVFMNYYWDSFAQDPDDWNRDTVLATNPEYRDKRDSRRSYTKTEAWILSQVGAEDDGGEGIAMWGGHGNDPYYYSLDTLKGIIDLQNGEKTCLIWPEMNGSSEAFAKVMEDRFYPLAEYARTNNANIFIRNKNIFWQGAVYLPAWERIRNGEFSEVFTSLLEETTDKTCELSVVGRMGLWASGALDSWGMRCSRDNPSFDRARQHSYQRLPNHFLRNMVYNLAGGATMLNVTYVDADYQSLAWELVAKGALFVPKREEIVSFNPVHLSMHDPDEHYLEDGENNKWTTFYDQSFEQNNPFVFSRMNGTWPAAPNTAWDFSRYAAGVKDRRQNFIPPYPNGTVLVTPVQDGVFANTNAARGRMTDHLHPMYKNIMQEFISNGRYYISSDGTATNAADTFYTTVANAITNSASRLPVTVSGDIAWIVAQTSPTHLRLTLVDSGYLNPKSRTATVRFNTVSPIAVTDVLDGTVFPVSGNSATINVPLGLWRFIDLELSEPFFPDNGWGEFSSTNGLPGNSWADTDGDGAADQIEYALNGDPKDAGSMPLSPRINFYPDSSVGFAHPQLVHSNPGIGYIQEWTTNLVSGPWLTNWSSYSSAATTNPAYNLAEQTLDGSAKEKLFFRLQITQP